MKALVIYDSVYENTSKLARAVGITLSKTYQTTVLPVNASDKINLGDVELLVIGSPTQGGCATVRTQEFIDKLPRLDGKKVAVFDSRFAENEHGFGLRLVMKAVGYAADKMAKQLTNKGGELITPPEGFIIINKTGPLKEGEYNRAGVWARNLSPSRVVLTGS